MYIPTFNFTCNLLNVNTVRSLSYYDLEYSLIEILEWKN